MVKYMIEQFPNLVLTEEVLSVLNSSCMHPEFKQKIFEALAYLNYFGLDPSFMNGRIRKVRDCMELIVKCKARIACTFIIAKDPDDTSRLELIHYANEGDGQRSIQA